VGVGTSSVLSLLLPGRLWGARSWSEARQDKDRNVLGPSSQLKPGVFPRLGLLLEKMSVAHTP
jgi:hypothetical protein